MDTTTHHTERRMQKALNHSQHNTTGLHTIVAPADVFPADPDLRHARPPGHLAQLVPDSVAVFPLVELHKLQPPPHKPQETRYPAASHPPVSHARHACTHARRHRHDAVAGNRDRARAKGKQSERAHVNALLFLGVGTVQRCTGLLLGGYCFQNPKRRV